MRWLVTGAQGMLGRDVVSALQGDGREVAALSHRDLDIRDEAAVRDACAGMDWVVNCAAWTAVDSAELHEGEAFAVNAIGAFTLARMAECTGARLIHISSDYVFDGESREPYPHDHPLSPLSAYGRTKAAGEWGIAATGANAIVVRTGWLYGAGGECFPTKIATAGRAGQPLRVVADQWGAPTWTVDVAKVLVRLGTMQAPSGTYHVTASGCTTWFEFSRAVLASDGQDQAKAEPIDSGTLASAARRPKYSVLAHDSLKSIGVAGIGDWLTRWQVAARRVLG